jgi:CubicO group peptidase (beta-lactamase class C family)
LPQLWKGKSSFPSNEDLLNAFTSRKRNLRFNPGAKFEYSNTGYAFLALIVERVSKQTFASFIEKNIFVPLEMNDSFVYDPRSKTTPKNRAFGFRRRGKNLVFAKDAELDGIMGDKGIFSTANDLYKWDLAIYQNKILPANVWGKAFEHTVLPNDSIVEYGLGWRLQSFVGNRVVHHPGWWAGFRTSFKRFVDDLGTLIILCNDDTSIADLVKELQEIVFYKELEFFNQFEVENGFEDEKTQKNS